MKNEKPDLIKIVRSLCIEQLGFDNKFNVITVYSDLEVFPPPSFKAFSSEPDLIDCMDKLNQGIKEKTNNIFKVGGYKATSNRLDYFTVIRNSNM